MKITVSATVLVSCGVGFVFGFVSAWPSAQRWGIVPPWQRFNDAALFFGISAVLSLTFLKILGRFFGFGDIVRAGCLMFGVALCYSLVRQEVTLLVWPALWALPGTFLGAAMGKFWLKRTATFETEAVAEREVRLQS